MESTSFGSHTDRKKIYPRNANSYTLLIWTDVAYLFTVSLKGHFEIQKTSVQRYSYTYSTVLLLKGAPKYLNSKIP